MSAEHGSEWHEPSEDEARDFFRVLTDVQRDAAADLIQREKPDRVTLRRVPEFEGQINEPLGVQFSDGRRFAVAADGSVTEYPRETRS